VRYTVKGIDAMLARGASRTDWARVRGMTDELEASIAADPDDVHAPLCTIHRWRDLTVWRRYERWRRLVQRSDANFPNTLLRAASRLAEVELRTALGVSSLPLPA
jgi:hypothetical protein